MPKLLTLLISVPGMALIAACDNAEQAPPRSQQSAVQPVTSTPPAAIMSVAERPTPIRATPTPIAAPLSETGEFTELDWDTLIPDDWRPDKLMAEYPIDEMSDDDPRAEELMRKLKVLWDASPVVPDLDGKQIKLPGFVVPLEMDAESIGEFLLVPYYGACIHVPPPPSNQTVYVQTAEGAEYHGELFDTVWVSGTLKVEAISSDLAEAGYRIQAVKVEPYE